jgi:hypothetical protein
VRDTVGRLSGLEIGFESVELGLKRHDGSPLGLCVKDGGAARFVEVTRRKLKETAAPGSRAVGLEIIPAGNDAAYRVSTPDR